MSSDIERARTELSDAQEHVIRAAVRWHANDPDFWAASRSLRQAVADLAALGAKQAERWPRGLK